MDDRRRLHPASGAPSRIVTPRRLQSHVLYSLPCQRAPRMSAVLHLHLQRAGGCGSLESLRPRFAPFKMRFIRIREPDWSIGILEARFHAGVLVVSQEFKGVWRCASLPSAVQDLCLSSRCAVAGAIALNLGAGTFS